MPEISKVTRVHQEEPVFVPWHIVHDDVGHTLPDDLWSTRGRVPLHPRSPQRHVHPARFQSVEHDRCRFLPVHQACPK